MVKHLLVRSAAGKRLQKCDHLKIKLRRFAFALHIFVYALRSLKYTKFSLNMT